MGPFRVVSIFRRGGELGIKYVIATKETRLDSLHYEAEVDGLESLQSIHRDPRSETERGWNLKLFSLPRWVTWVYEHRYRGS